MTGRLKFTSASDKDIFDLLMSSRQKLTDKSLSEMFLLRGLIMSRETTRYELCETISRMPHDRKSLLYMIEMRESASRSEKRTFTELNVELSPEEIDNAINAYARGPGIRDKITVQSRRAKGMYFNVEYDEIDYSKTRLMQTQKRDVGIEFTSSGGRTTIRMPSNEKALEIVNVIKSQLEALRLERIEQIDVSLEGLGALARTEFFMRVIRGINGYNLNSVVGMKVASDLPDDDLSSELDIDPDGLVGEELLSKVNKVALSGHNLVQTEEYQTLLKNGFFLTAIAWRAEQVDKPNDILQFEVSFRNSSEGTGFRLNAKIARRLKRTGDITDNFVPLEENRRPAVWALIESASKEIVSGIRVDFKETGTLS